MAVKIRLRRMLLSIESSLLILDLQEMENLSRKLEHMIQTQIQAQSK